MASSLNIAAYRAHTRALGPGVRAVIWVQGCPFRCQGCIAPAWIPFEPAMSFAPEEILEKLDLQSIDGMTFSGGEPMMQAAGLADVMRLARKKKDLSLICFTGFRYERLLKNPPSRGVHELLREVDVLIDGPYVAGRQTSVGLRGSSNQRVIHLTPRLEHSDLESLPRRIEVSVSDGELRLVGIPTGGMNHAFAAALQNGWKG